MVVTGCGGRTGRRPRWAGGPRPGRVQGHPRWTGRRLPAAASQTGTHPRWSPSVCG